MRWLTGCVVVAMVVMAGGCRSTEPVETHPEVLSVPDRTISVQQLAQRLGMAIEEDRPSSVTLHSGANRVMLIPDPGGHAYVNGMRVGPEGGFLRVRGVLYVPETLEGDIRSALHPQTGVANPGRITRPLPATARPPLARAYRVVVDPGHGGKDPGTKSRMGLEEKTITLPVAKELARLLKQDGFNVVMTRQTDVFVELDERGAIANRLSADLFVSIHADACADPSMRGFAVYTSRLPSAGSRGVAQDVAEALRGIENEGLGTRQANYRVLVVSQCPAILVELGYLSNGLDAEMLADHAVQTKLARSIADGIAAYFRR